MENIFPVDKIWRSHGRSLYDISRTLAASLALAPEVSQLKFLNFIDKEKTEFPIISRIHWLTLEMYCNM